MTAPMHTDPDLGRELFRCRPKPLPAYLALREQGALPPYGGLKFLSRISPFTSTIFENVVLAGIPMALLIFVLQVGFGLKPPHEPSWVKPAYLAALVVFLTAAVCWYWLAPAADVVIAYERGLRWRISLSRWHFFGSHGCLTAADLESFTYRSDCLGPEPVDCGSTTAEKLNRILLELNLSRHDIRFHLKNNRDIVVEKLFARFEPNDLRRLLTHLATLAEPHCITV